MIAFPIIWILFGIAAAMAAAQRGRSGCGWFALGVLLGPFGLIFALLSPPVVQQKDASTIVSENISPEAYRPLEQETKKCPHCAETIKLEARKCRFCGEGFSPEEVEKEITARREEIAREFQELQRGRKRCPACGHWDVHQACLEDGGYGDWCPHCRRPVKYTPS